MIRTSREAERPEAEEEPVESDRGYPLPRPPCPPPTSSTRDDLRTSRSPPTSSRQDDARRCASLAGRLFRENQDVNERVMDSTDLEREKDHDPRQEHGRPRRRRQAQHHRRQAMQISAGRSSAAHDGRRCPCLSNASEGLLPQTPSSLLRCRRACPSSSSSTRSIATTRPEEVINEVYEPSSTSTPTNRRSTSRSSTPTRAWTAGPRRRARADLEALVDTPPRPFRPVTSQHPLQALVTNLDASPYLGRLALCRIHHGTIRKGQQIAWCRSTARSDARVTELFITEALDRVPAERRAGRSSRSPACPR